ncbi:MAG TPA: DEAD/DEAH box helicase [Clostridia bacterium]|nr:DEAD/DEAH box helicase [Clostridia bacterium]
MVDIENVGVLFLKLNVASLDRMVDQATYARGVQYFFEGRVGELEVDLEGTIRAMVRGTFSYQVILETNEDGKLLRAGCNCPAFYQYEGFCKHIVATIIAAERSCHERGYKKQGITDLLFHSFTRRPEEEKTPVQLEINLEARNAHDTRRGISYFLSFRVGVDYLYVIRNTRRFMEDLHQEKNIRLGKRLTLNWEEHRFEPVDEQVIQLLLELYEVEQAAEYYYGTESRLFPGRTVYLPPRYLNRLLDILSGRQFNLTIFGQTFEGMEIKQEDLPAEFILDQKGHNLVLRMSSLKNVIPLVPSGEFIFAGERIWRISQAQRRHLLPFCEAAKRFKTDKVVFPPEDQEKFAAYVLPVLAKEAKLIMAKPEEKLFCREPLITRIYFDKEGERITARIDFVYGGNKINPFGRNDRSFSGPVIVRDLEKEREALGFFERAEFKVKGPQVYLEDDTRIFEFMVEGLPELQKVAEVYYSDSFKKINLNRPVSFQGGIRLQRETDLLEFDFSIEGIDAQELQDVFAALRLQKKYYRLKDGSFLPLENQQLIRVNELLKELGLKEEDLSAGKITLPKFRAPALEEKLDDLSLGFLQKDEYFTQLVDRLTSFSQGDVRIPASLAGILREYQKVGFYWLKTLAACGFGGILGDEMGLGKTLQAIAFLLSERNHRQVPDLVVAPTSLLYNWEAEVKKFAPSLKCLVVAGTKSERRGLLEKHPRVDLLITSYPLLRRDIEEYSRLRFGYCILDEAQNIKNPASLNARCVKRIRSEGRFALTGTPMENSLTELWSIFDFLMPGYLLSHRQFVEKFEKPIVREGDQKALERLKRQVKYFVLRRLKQDVLKELPLKIENTMQLELTRAQKKVYLAYLARAREEIANDLEVAGLNRSRIKILAVLTRLRQICCHPGMFLENYQGDSGKMEALQEILEELIAGGHRILLFSQFTKALSLIKKYLEEASISYLYLDGTVKSAERLELVDSFNSGEGDVFLISLKAGGTGLNLVGADTVIHFDPWWNPAVEDQATDRAHRIGQENPVHVIKLITRGTIEEKVLALQEKKKEMLAGVLDSGPSFITRLNEKEIRELFDI